MKSLHFVFVVIAGMLAFGVADAKAQCVTKAAEATSGTAESAKWFALETMVQAVSWGLWPGFVATGQVAGYKIKSQKFFTSRRNFVIIGEYFSKFSRKGFHGQVNLCPR